MSLVPAALLGGSPNQEGLISDRTTAIKLPQGADQHSVDRSVPRPTVSGLGLAGTDFSSSETGLVLGKSSFGAGPVAYRGSGTTKPLTNGVTVVGSLNGTDDSEMWFMNVSSGARVMLSTLSTQPSNYFSLYGKFGSYPTTSSYDWSWTWDNSITRRYYSPQAGTWYIMAYSPSGKGTYLLTVTVFYTGTIQSLTSGVTVTGYLNATAASDLWYIYVSSGATSMSSVLTCPSNTDFDLYGDYESYPDTANYNWRGMVAGNESIMYSSPSQGGWYIMPYSYFGNGTYQLTVTVAYSPAEQYLSNGVTESDTLSGTGDYDIWYIYASSGATRMRAVLTCPSGADFNLYGKLGSYATTSYYDWRGVANGSEDVTCSYPGYGYWYILVNSLNGSGIYQLTVTITYPQYLLSGNLVTGSLSTPGNYDVWCIYVYSGATNMHSILTCSSGADFDLYGCWESAPTTYSYNWAGFAYGSEDVSYSNPNSGTWYIMVRSVSGSGTYELTVTVSYSQPYVYGIIIPITILFVMIVFVVLLVASGRRSSDSWSSSTYPRSHAQVEEPATQEERAQIAAPRLVQCKLCGASMKQDDNNCWNCGAPTKAKLISSPATTRQTRERTRSGICMVCKRGLEKTDEILFCPNCGGLAHKDHMLEWLHVKDYCPTCGRHLDVAEVKKQSDPQPGRRQQKNPRNRTG